MADNVKSCKRTTRSSLTITAWNARGLQTGVAYTTHLLDTSDVLILSEHWVPEHELFKIRHLHPEFNALSTAGKCISTNSSHAWGGVAILWRKEIDIHVSLLNCKSNRICGICLHEKGYHNLYIIGVYLPQVACKNESFMEELELLEELMKQCLMCGDVIIMGDMNCHYGMEFGPRGWGKTTTQAKHLYEMAVRGGLSIIDLQKHCIGPRHTYCSSNNGKSYIDHCLISNTLVESVVKCEVVEDCIINTSDHLPVQITVRAIVSQTVHTQPIIQDTAWHKLSCEEIQCQYTKLVSIELPSHLDKIEAWYTLLRKEEVSHEQLDCIVQTITNVLLDCSKQLPKKGCNKALKPYWTYSLKCLCKRKKEIYRIWKLAGRPRGDDSDIWREYKLVKKIFRKEQRVAMKQYELRNMKEFVEQAEVDSSYYWHMVNVSRKAKHKRVSPVKDNNGNVLIDTHEINQAWFDYFKNMFTPKADVRFDEEWYQQVNEYVSKQTTAPTEPYNTHLFDVPFSESELAQCVKSLKKKKASGWDRISSEHIKYGGDSLHNCILYVFNCMRKLECIPKSLNKGVLVPLPKGDKDPMIRENNRGITLLPVLNKLYQCLLKVRMGDDIESKIVSVQGAGKKQVSCLHTSLLLRETVEHNKQLGKSVYIAFLDVSKAFDCVWIEGMLYKLYKTGVDAKLCRIIKNMYCGFQCTVRTAHTYSDWFDVTQGVQQGAPLSMLLYELFMNDLLSQLRSSKLGACIDDIEITCPSYADDTAIVATHPCKMQCLLDMAFEHSTKWRYRFNALKSEVLCLDHKKNKVTFWLGKEVLPVVHKCKHLGTIMTPHVKEEVKFVKDNIRRARRTLLAVNGIGSNRVPMSTRNMSKLYWSLCVPTMTYGTEVLCLGSEARADLESAHWAVAKQIQHLPKHTPGPCVIPQLGWISINGYMDMISLLFLWRIFLLPMSSIYKNVVLKRMIMCLKSGIGDQRSASPVINVMQIAKKYKVISVILDSVTTGVYMSLVKWKVLIKHAIREIEWKKHTVASALCKKSHMFNDCIKCRALWPWYMHASRYPELSKKVTTLMRLTIGMETENERHNGTAYCECTPDQRKTVSHILFECVNIESQRMLLWNEVTNVLPQTFMLNLKKMSIHERTNFILSGFNCKYTQEWSNIYTCMLNFICKMLNFTKLP